MGQAMPDAIWGNCDDCDTFTRLFRFVEDSDICLSCYRSIVEAVLETVHEESDDAAS